MLLKMSDHPIFKVINRCVELRWGLKRHWVNSYMQKDVFDVYDDKGKILYTNLSFSRLKKITNGEVGNG